TSALEPSASVISLCQSSSFGHAQSCTGCLASPQFVRSRNRSGEPSHDHPHELASRIQRRRLASSMPTRVREQCQSHADADETPHCLQMHRTVPGPDPPSVLPRQPRQVSEGKLTRQAAPQRWSRQPNLTRSCPEPCGAVAIRHFPCCCMRRATRLDMLNPPLGRATDQLSKSCSTPTGSAYAATQISSLNGIERGSSRAAAMRWII